jgi:hypothetical protein
LKETIMTDQVVKMYSGFVMIIAETNLATSLAKEASLLCKEAINDNSIHPDCQEISNVFAVPLSKTYKESCSSIVKIMTSPFVDQDGWITPAVATVKNINRLTSGYNLMRYSRIIGDFESIKMTHSSLVGVESKKHKKKFPIPNLTIFGGSNKGKENSQIESPEVCARRECWEETKILFSDNLFSEETQLRLRAEKDMVSFPYNTQLAPNADSAVGSSFYSILLPDNVRILRCGNNSCGKCLYLTMPDDNDEPVYPDRNIFQSGCS